MGTEFTAEQKRYLEGFVSGLAATRAAGGLVGSAAPAPTVVAEPTGPDAAAHRAMARTEAEGRKLVPEEKGKREELGLDSYARMKQHAQDGVFPKGPDIFRWKFHGLFYVAPTQDSFMCRLRIPNGIMKYWQFAGVADIAAKHAGGYSNVTTRANLQVREIPATVGPILLEKLIGLGLTSRGAGADNIRNVTGGPTAGIDPQELLDTRPSALEWHHHILADRSLYGLPRKFNVAFDGGGRIGALEDTNDIGFQAVEVAAGFGVEPGVWFRLVLGGITGHLDLARDTGIIVRPQDATKLADAIVRVFIDHGDRTDRKKARLKYLLDAWGFEKFLTATEEKLGTALIRVPAQAVAKRPEPDRLGHVGVHAQKQPGLNWVGVVLPVGKMTAEQMHGLARIARDLGDGDLRLTVWQNLILSGVSDANVALVEAALEALGLTSRATAIRAGLVACTGAAGCKFGNADTKATADAIARHCEERVEIDVPVNIHVTGCHNSCAQHYIGDIGLVGARVPVNDDGDTVEGYHLLVGGGFGADAAIGRELYRDVKADDAPMVVEGLLKTWIARRATPTETLAQFTRRHEPEALRALVEEAAE